MNFFLGLLEEPWVQWGRDGGRMHPGMDWGYGTHWFGGILMIIFWIAVIVGIIVLIRWLILSKGSGGSSRGQGSLEILRQRYARGEIDREEFEEKKRDLET
jgi:putative membrane protein